MLKMFLSIAFLGALGLVLHLYKVLVREPAKIRKILKRQGIDGPPPKLIFGNMLEMRKKPNQGPKPAADHPTDKTQLDHDWIKHLFPYLEQWREQYGEMFTFSLGSIHVIYVNKPDLVKEITTFTSYDLGKPSYHRKEFGNLLGEGILTSNGPTWAYHRKVLAPELYMENVKGMVHIFAASANTLVEAWTRRIEAEDGLVDITIDEYMRTFSGDVISRACFGSNYVRGQEIFDRLKTLQEATCSKYFSIGFPAILRSLPTKANLNAWKLEKEIHNLILEVVKERKARGAERDLLQMVLEAADTGEMTLEQIDQFVVSNCKNVFLAANEASAIGASWCLMLLAAHPEWQERIRAEVIEICQGQTPNADMIRKMKQVTWVLQETLRLYPSGPALSREALKDMGIGDIFVPKGVNLWTMVATMHMDPEIWGPDVHSFNPARFANGVASACKLPHVYLPFGFGPRICVGQHLAMVEIKMLIAMIVSNFSFSLSPKYVHAPTFKLVIKPGFGVNLLIKKL